MSSVPRRKLSELVARYTLEPAIKDIYVEGDFDRDIINCWFLINKVSEPKVFPVNLIEITDDCLDKYRMTSGNKQRVIALAHELSTPNLQGYICLVDMDFEGINDTKYGDVHRLIRTDYCSLELYYYDPDLLMKLLMVCGVSINNIGSFISSFEMVLRNIFAIRATLDRLNWNVSWIDVDKNLSYKNDVLYFDEKAFVRKILINGGKSNELNEFNEAFDQVFIDLNEDARMSIRGHDYVSMIAYISKNCKGKKEYQSASAIERLFLMEHQKVDRLIDRIMDSFA